MSTQKLAINFDKKAIKGVASLTDSQVRGWARQSSRLRSDLTYVAVPQMVHSEEILLNNAKVNSNRIFVIGVNDQGIAVEALTLSVNGLRQSHYGFVNDNPQLQISAEIRDGLKRAIANTPMHSVFINGGLPLTIHGKNASVSRPFAFQLKGRKPAFVANFTQRADKKWDINTKMEEGKEYVDLQTTTVNIYDECINVPEVDATGVIPDEYLVK